MTLCSRKLSGSASAANVANTLDKVFNEYDNISLKDKVTTATTDEASVMNAAFMEVDIERRNCILHRLHNCVRDNLPYDSKKKIYINFYILCCFGDKSTVKLSSYIPAFLVIS